LAPDLKKQKTPFDSPIGGDCNNFLLISRHMDPNDNNTFSLASEGKACLPKPITYSGLSCFFSFNS
jgi:hypothetical protein